MECWFDFNGPMRCDCDLTGAEGECESCTYYTWNAYKSEQEEKDRMSRDT